MENITSFTRYHSNSLQSDNVDNIGEINNFLMIEAQLTKIIGQLRYDSVYLLNDAKYILQDKPLLFSVENNNRMDENVEKALSLTTELPRKRLK